MPGQSTVNRCPHQIATPQGCARHSCGHRRAACGPLPQQAAWKGGGGPGGKGAAKSQMGEKPLQPPPADLVYLYDGSFEGLLCCVHESVYARQLPAGIWPEAEAQPTLFPQRGIPTNAEKAARVAASIPKKIGLRAQEMVQKIFLSGKPGKELAILRFLLLGYRVGGQAVHMLGHPDVAAMIDAEKHLDGEVHLLKGFIRFFDYGGALAAQITPKNFVLPFLAPHFTERYNQENFLIFDKTHKAALIYQDRKQQILPMEHIEFPQADEKEEACRALWRQFYKTIAIEARTNHKCRRTQMPKRYWENMTEMQEFL